MRKSKHTILIICEGKNTEPLFFNSIRNEIINHTYEVDATITIWPEPIIEEDEDENKTENNLHKKQRIRRNVKPSTIGPELEEIKGIPPEKWVRAGLKELETGAFEEVWAVFDHDNHPNRKEAFELAEKEISGKKVQIAYSSRSFEYYLLLHFERIYKIFQETDCKEIIKVEGKKDKKIIIKCGTEEHPNDCKGGKCINGYARLRNYWTESKDKVSLFPILKNKLEFGFENAAWIRYQSEQIEKNTPKYDRNPYTSVDLLIKKLTGFNSIEWTWINDKYDLNGIHIEIIDNQAIRIENRRNLIIIIQANTLIRTNILTREVSAIGRRAIIDPNKSEVFKFPIIYDQENFIDSFKLDDFVIIFDYSRFSNNISKFIEKLFKLTHKELTTLINDLKNKLS
jgi:hypothetical protein